MSNKAKNSPIPNRKLLWLVAVIGVGAIGIFFWTRSGSSPGPRSQDGGAIDAALHHPTLPADLAVGDASKVDNLDESLNFPQTLDEPTQLLATRITSELRRLEAPARLSVISIKKTEDGIDILLSDSDAVKEWFLQAGGSDSLDDELHEKLSQILGQKIDGYYVKTEQNTIIHLDDAIALTPVSK